MAESGLWYSSEQIIHVVLDHLEGQDTWDKKPLQRHHGPGGLQQGLETNKPGDIVT